MRKTTTVVIGAGHAGLAMSRCLAERSIDHVVLERGEVANSWRTERWDSLRLLTPNWQTRLPGFAYEGTDPDGFRTMPEVVDLIGRYARMIAAPVETQTKVISLRRSEGGYLVADRPRRLAGPHGGRRERSLQPAGCAKAGRGGAGLDSSADAAAVSQSRTSLPKAGVLVVGASATGVQLADEIHRSGRPVLLAVRRARPRAPHLSRIATSSGGWTASACWTSATTRSRTSPGRADCRRSSWWARPSGRQLDLNALSRDRRRAGRPHRRHRRGPAPVLGIAAQSLRAGRPQAGPAARHHRPLGRRARPRRRRRAALPLRADLSRRIGPGSAWTSRAARSGPSSGPPASGRTIPGSTCRCSIARARSCTKAASWRRQGSTPWGCRSCAAGSRR